MTVRYQPEISPVLPISEGKLAGKILFLKTAEIFISPLCVPIGTVRDGIALSNTHYYQATVGRAS